MLRLLCLLVALAGVWLLCYLRRKRRQMQRANTSKYTPYGQQADDDLFGGGDSAPRLASAVDEDDEA